MKVLPKPGISRGGTLTDYAFSMPKLGATPTKAAQLNFANFLDFRGFHRGSGPETWVTQRT
jgi:hypothetical protein